MWTLGAKKSEYFNLLKMKAFFRPISCYTASRVSEVVEDISLDEKLVRCDYQDDVCFGKVRLFFVEH